MDESERVERLKQHICYHDSSDRDYMKNVDKLNEMINEFKGCVSMARAALKERKDSEQKPL